MYPSSTYTCKICTGSDAFSYTTAIASVFPLLLLVFLLLFLLLSLYFLLIIIVVVAAVFFAVFIMNATEHTEVTTT